jgi:hypothetical protein
MNFVVFAKGDGSKGAVLCGFARRSNSVTGKEFADFPFTVETYVPLPEGDRSQECLRFDLQRRPAPGRTLPRRSAATRISSTRSFRSNSRT